jgi:hypothetical protein
VVAKRIRRWLSDLGGIGGRRMRMSESVRPEESWARPNQQYWAQKIDTPSPPPSSLTQFTPHTTPKSPTRRRRRRRHPSPSHRPPPTSPHPSDPALFAAARSPTTRRRPFLPRL